MVTPHAIPGYRHKLFIIGFFFFIFGFITWVNATLIQYLTIACDLQKEWQSYLVTFAFYISYTVLAVPSGLILNKTGMVKGMQLGLITMAAGCVLFIPAAMSRTYLVFLLALFIIGMGLTILQTAVNPYVTMLGSVNKAAQRISIMGICNKLAGVIAPLIFGAIILSNADVLEHELSTLTGFARTERLDELSSKVIWPYAVMAGALLVTGILLRYAGLPEVSGSVQTVSSDRARQSVLKYPSLLMGIVAVFFSVAAEVIAGDSIGRYGQFHGFSLDVAKTLPSYSLFGMIIGYVLGILFIPKIITQEKAFGISNVLGILCVVGILVTDGATSVYFLAFTGFANAMLWPVIWPNALKGLPPNLLNAGSALLIMGIAGGAIMPLMYGWLADLQNNQTAYWILIPGYAYNIVYWMFIRRK
jgi:MFS transporter, FHS family, L-fucose permease